jgi:hypothetical protein
MTTTTTTTTSAALLTPTMALPVKKATAILTQGVEMVIVVAVEEAGAGVPRWGVKAGYLENQRVGIWTHDACMECQ